MGASRSEPFRLDSRWAAKAAAGAVRPPISAARPPTAAVLAAAAALSVVFSAIPAEHEERTEERVRTTETRAAGHSETRKEAADNAQVCRRVCGREGLQLQPQ